MSTTSKTKRKRRESAQVIHHIQTATIQAAALRPHFKDLELRLRPGLTTLTWTSMNIDAYVAQARRCVRRMDAWEGG